MCVSAEASVGNGLEVINKERDQRAGTGLAGRKNLEPPPSVTGVNKGRDTVRCGEQGTEGHQVMSCLESKTLGGLLVCQVKQNPSQVERRPEGEWE